ncbi:MAG: divergent PAP2 family protein [Alkaliphilus sp.]
MTFFNDILYNEVLWVSVTAWFVAQALKVVHTFIVDKHFNIWRFIGSGGMPSSHSSFVVGLTTAVGLVHGWDSTIFAVALVSSLVVMYDAAGVRRAVGKQAAIINQIIEDWHEKKSKPFNEKRLKELIGHTPVEVIAGATLGIIIANIMI